MIADLVDVARAGHCAPAQRVPYLAFQNHALQTLALQTVPDTPCAYYLRVASPASAVAERTLLRTLRQCGVQARIHGRYTQPQQQAHHVVLTQPLAQATLQQALAQLARRMDATGVAPAIQALRVEPLAS